MSIRNFKNNHLSRYGVESEKHLITTYRYNCENSVITPTQNLTHGENQKHLLRRGVFTEKLVKIFSIRVDITNHNQNIDTLMFPFVNTTFNVKQTVST